MDNITEHDASASHSVRGGIAASVLGLCRASIPLT